MSSEARGDPLLVRGSDVAAFLRRMLQEFRENPLVNINSLAYAGMVISSIGFLKDNDALKLLGDLISDAPDKLRNLISLRYSLMGTLGEIQAIVTRIADESISMLTKILSELADMFERNSLDNERLLKVIGELYELLVVRVPTVALQSE